MKVFIFSSLCSLSIAAPQLELLGLSFPAIPSISSSLPGSSGNINTQYFYGPNGKYRLVTLVGPAGTITNKEYVSGTGSNASTLVGASGSTASSIPRV
jgi:hypothetical protein